MPATLAVLRSSVVRGELFGVVLPELCGACRAGR